MIVEDDPMVASVNETYLCRLPGFCVIAKAADGLQALEKIKALSGSVDLVLLDVFMPKMDGLSFRHEEPCAVGLRDHDHRFAE